MLCPPPLWAHYDIMTSNSLSQESFEVRAELEVNEFNFNDGNDEDVADDGGVDGVGVGVAEMDKNLRPDRNFDLGRKKAGNGIDLERLKLDRQLKQVPEVDDVNVVGDGEYYNDNERNPDREEADYVIEYADDDYVDLNGPNDNDI